MGMCHGFQHFFNPAIRLHSPFRLYCVRNRRRTATAKMVVIYRKPADVKAFEKHYCETHIPLAKKIPGLRKYEISNGPITAIAGPPDVYLIGTADAAPCQIF